MLELKKWLTDSQYQSSNITSELGKTMGHTVLREIIGDINPRCAGPAYIRA